MLWELSHRCDRSVRPMADRHYNRQSHGAPNFVPPGRCLVLRTKGAFWVTSWPFAEYTKHGWAGVWVCSAFRREDIAEELASSLITQAVAATLWTWPSVPRVRAWEISRRANMSRITEIEVCMVTMVDTDKTKRKRDPGRCFRKAGFVEIGRTKCHGLVVLGLPVRALPAAETPIGAQQRLL